MGLFKEEGLVYKPVEEVDLGPTSHENYLRANVKGSSTFFFFFFFCHIIFQFLYILFMQLQQLFWGFISLSFI